MVQAGSSRKNVLIMAQNAPIRQKQPVAKTPELQTPGDGPRTAHTSMGLNYPKNPETMSPKQFKPTRRSEARVTQTPTGREEVIPTGWGA